MSHGNDQSAAIAKPAPLKPVTGLQNWWNGLSREETFLALLYGFGIAVGLLLLAVFITLLILKAPPAGISIASNTLLALKDSIQAMSGLAFSLTSIAVGLVAIAAITVSSFRLEKLEGKTVEEKLEEERTNGPYTGVPTNDDGFNAEQTLPSVPNPLEGDEQPEVPLLPAEPQAAPGHQGYPTIPHQSKQRAPSSPSHQEHAYDCSLQQFVAMSTAKPSDDPMGAELKSTDSDGNAADEKPILSANRHRAIGGAPLERRERPRALTDETSDDETPAEKNESPRRSNSQS